MPEHTVLLAEDEPKLGEIYATWLSESYSVTHLDSGDALVDALDHATDAVVTDWRIAGLQQRDLLTALAESEHDPALVVISGIEPRIDLDAFGVDAYLEKPFNCEALTRTLDSLLPESVPAKTASDPAIGNP